MSLSIHTKRESASFVCRLNFLNIAGGLGRGERIDDTFYITNDRTVIESLTPHDYKDALGTLEYKSLRESALIAYSPVQNLSPEDHQKEILTHLLRLDSFENFFWLFYDCCFGHEIAFLFHRMVGRTQISSNIYRGLRSLADGSSQELAITADQFREIIRTYRTLHKPNNNPPAHFATKDNSNRVSRTLSLIDRARASMNFAEKIAFYCSGLEAMFSTSHTELTHQIAERVALISSDDKAERFESFRFVKRCYSFRSKFIHGDTVKGDVPTLSAMSQKLDGVSRKAIGNALRDTDFLGAMSDQEKLETYFYEKIFE
ncbi:hypothetical protein [Bradyrhizobium sp. 613_E4_N2_2]|uniref:hypothetical protein n=1 Tax=Bradyrhizobium sp. 613_E4_N2_2 TaxID=3240371 RepID=UPI003F8AA326